MRELRPCPCAREWLAAMIEEGVRRMPEDAGATWLVGWLLSSANMSLREQDAIMIRLENAASKSGDSHVEK